MASSALRQAGDANVLLIADSDGDSDLFYATEFLVGDPMIYLELGGKKILLVSDLEYGRALKEAKVDEIIATSPIEQRIRESKQVATTVRIAHEFLKERGVDDVVVPANFPFSHAEKLRELGCAVECREDPFFPERVVKTKSEVEAIHKSQQAAEEAMEFVIDEIRRSDIRGDTLFRGDEPLTADWLRREAHKLLLDRDYQASHTIIAGGDLGCDPHQRGFGPLPAHRTIIIDIFPRSLQSRYWGDITRTVVRGRASAEVRKLYDDVLETQEEAIAALEDDVDGRDVNQGVIDRFESQGNATEERDGVKVGFIHSTGHGVGLDIHEGPKLGRAKSRIRAGHVVTIEPGLYYPGVGAVRLEDLLVVTETGSRNLTSFPKELEV